MTETTVREACLPGPVPRFEIPEWRERHGVVAGITGRGADESGFDLRLWTRTAEPDCVAVDNWRRFRAALPEFPAVVSARQIHGAEVAWHEARVGWQLLDGLDGHATATPGVLLTVTVADCIPVYLVDPGRRVIALLHAGWRGVAAGVLGRGLRLLLDHGASVKQIAIHCGVGVCGGCYQVGAEVMGACGSAQDGTGPWHLNLRRILAGQAMALGVETVSVSQWCSAHDRAFFFSHRASGGRDGRMVAYLGLLP